MQRLYKFKGSLSTYNDLLEKTDNNVGDVWNILENNTNYCWDGQEWIDIGTEIDMSNYATKEQFEETNQKIEQTTQELVDDMTTRHVGTNIKAPTKAGHGTKHSVRGVTSEDFSCVADDVNLFDINNVEQGGYEAATGIKAPNGTLSRTAGYISVTPNSDYIISNITADTRIFEYNSQKAFIQTQVAKNKVAFKLSANTTYITMHKTLGFESDFKLQKGSIATPCSSFGKGTVQIFSKNGDNIVSDVIQTKPLETEEDKVDYDTGKIIRENESITYGDITSWGIDEERSTDTIFAAAILFTKRNLKNRDDISCNILENKAGDFEASSGEHITLYSNFDGALLFLSKEKASNLDEFKKYLASNNLKIRYKLAEAVEEDIVCTNKIYQFAESTEFWERSGGKLELSVTNNEAIAQINEDIQGLQECNRTQDLFEKITTVTGAINAKRSCFTRSGNTVCLSIMIDNTVNFDASTILAKISQTYIPSFVEEFITTACSLFDLNGAGIGEGRLLVYKNGDIVLQYNNISGNVRRISASIAWNV